MTAYRTFHDKASTLLRTPGLDPDDPRVVYTRARLDEYRQGLSCGVGRIESVVAPRARLARHVLSEFGQCVRTSLVHYFENWKLRAQFGLPTFLSMALVVGTLVYLNRSGSEMPTPEENRKLVA